MSLPNTSASWIATLSGMPAASAGAEERGTDHRRFQLGARRDLRAPLARDQFLADAFDAHVSCRATARNSSQTSSPSCRAARTSAVTMVPGRSSRSSRWRSSFCASALADRQAGEQAAEACRRAAGDLRAHRSPAPAAAPSSSRIATGSSTAALASSSSASVEGTMVATRGDRARTARTPPAAPRAAAAARGQPSPSARPPSWIG